MPINYKEYPANWKTVIRPDILRRANHKRECCGIKNKLVVIRGVYNGIDVYQDFDEDEGAIYNALNSDYIGHDYVGEVDIENKNNIIEIILTIAYLDHDITNNDYTNLKALCQRCHNRYDASNRKLNRIKNKKQFQLI